MTSAARLRPVDEGDLDNLHALIERIETSESLPYLTARDEVTEIFEDSMNPAPENLRILEHNDGSLLGWGQVVHSPSGVKLERAFVPGGVSPDAKRQGYGQILLDWQTKRATERLDATPGDLEAIILAERYSWQDEKHELFQSNGYVPARYFDELQRPLSGELPAATSPPGITIVPFTSEHIEPARLVYNVAFLDHWGTTPRSAKAWSFDVIDCFGRRLDLSFVAFDGDDMVAYCLNAHYPQDEQVTGRRDGWIDSICTLAPHRGRGIASSLIAHSLQAFEGAGLNSSMLGVDSDNPSGAYGIYEKSGYRPLNRNLSYIRTVRHGAEPVKMF